MWQRTIALGLVAICALGCSRPDTSSHDRAQAEGTLVLQAVAVVPMDREVVLPDRDVLLADDRIVDVAPSGSLASPPTARRVDAAGSYVMPGLFDVHVHVEREDELLLSTSPTA